MKFKELKRIILPALYSKLTQAERAEAREKYIQKQKGLCWFCKEPLDEVPALQVRRKKLNLNMFPAGFLRHPIHLHHDHDTDLTIGAVHAECNGYLWQYLGQ